MDKVFVGSEASGYYSNAEACKGVFVDKEIFDKYEDVLRDVFNSRTFYELDGKHSEVDGDLIVININNVSDMLEVIYQKDAEYEAYHLTEYLDEDIKELEDNVKKVYQEIEELSAEYTLRRYTLTEEESVKVVEFIREMRAK